MNNNGIVTEEPALVNLETLNAGSQRDKNRIIDDDVTLGPS
jgi:hypothetical protein